jgi:hypothetical protein
MNTKHWILVLAACAVSALSGGCLKDKVLDLVVTGETYGDFVQNETSAVWNHPAAVDVGQEIREILHTNGYEDADLKGAHVTSMHYGVVDFSQTHDWTITGSITVTYKGNTQTVPDYTSQSVQAALGRSDSRHAAVRRRGLINAALQDFVDGQNPVLVFRIDNGSTTPAPSVVDPMQFVWRAWLTIQVILKQKVTVRTRSDFIALVVEVNRPLAPEILTISGAPGRSSSHDARGTPRAI